MTTAPASASSAANSGVNADRSTGSRRIPATSMSPIPPGRRKTLPVETSRHAFAYVFAGSGSFRNASDPRQVKTDRVGGGSVALPGATKSATAHSSFSTAAKK